MIGLIVAALLFTWIYLTQFSGLRYVPLMALAGIPTAIALLSVRLVIDRQAIALGLIEGYVVFLVVIGGGVIVARWVRSGFGGKRSGA